MSEEVFARSLELVQHFIRAGTQGSELNLAGIGESTLHPRFIEYATRAREVIGPDRRLVLATNGLLITEELVSALAPLKPTIFVSLHRPEKAGPAVDLLRDRGLLAGVSADPSVARINWAGQINVRVTAATVGSPCPWLGSAKVMVLSDGRIAHCSMDATGVGVVGHINDDFNSLRTHPSKLCRGCHHTIRVPGFLQSEATAPSRVARS